MDKSSVEVKSALWQKVLAALICLPLLGTGVACWLAPFVPNFVGEKPDVGEALFYGAIILVTGFAFWWTILRYSIRADSRGICQSNGFFRQEVRWEEVSYYYVEPNRRFHRERRLHIEPVMFDASGAEVFRGFAHLLVSTRSILEQRRELWQFVEAHLDGKKVEKPLEIDFTPDALVRRSMKVDWKTKTVKWKIARSIGLVIYAVFWCALAMAPMYYVLTQDTGRNNSGTGFWLLMLFLFCMVIGPILPYLIRLQLKKRKIVREWETRDKTES